MRQTDGRKNKRLGRLDILPMPQEGDDAIQQLIY